MGNSGCGGNIEACPVLSPGFLVRTGGARLERVRPSTPHPALPLKGGGIKEVCFSPLPPGEGQGEGTGKQRSRKRAPHSPLSLEGEG